MSCQGRTFGRILLGAAALLSLSITGCNSLWGADPVPGTISSGTTGPAGGVSGSLGGSGGSIGSSGSSTPTTLFSGQAYDGPVSGAIVDLFADPTFQVTLSAAGVLTNASGKFQMRIPIAALEGVPTLYLRTHGGTDTHTGLPAASMAGAIATTGTTPVVAVTPASTLVVGIMGRDPTADVDSARRQVAGMFGLGETFELNVPDVGTSPELIGINGVIAQAALSTRPDIPTVAGRIEAILSSLASGIASGSVDVTGLATAAATIQGSGRTIGSVAIHPPPALTLEALEIGDAIIDLAAASIHMSNFQARTVTASPVESIGKAILPDIALDLGGRDEVPEGHRFDGGIDVTLIGTGSDQRLLAIRILPVTVALSKSTAPSVVTRSNTHLAISGTDADGHAIRPLVIARSRSELAALIEARSSEEGLRLVLHPAGLLDAIRAQDGTSGAGHPSTLIDTQATIDLAISFNGLPVVNEKGRVARIEVDGLVHAPGSSPTSTGSSGGTTSTTASAGTTGTAGTAGTTGATTGSGGSGGGSSVGTTPTSTGSAGAGGTSIGSSGTSTGTAGASGNVTSTSDSGSTTSTAGSGSTSGRSGISGSTGSGSGPGASSSAAGTTTTTGSSAGTVSTTSAAGSSTTTGTSGSAGSATSSAASGTTTGSGGTSSSSGSASSSGGAGSSGGSSGSSTTTTSSASTVASTSITGQVFDGPVDGATVQLYADAAFTQPLPVGPLATDAQGSFHARVPTTALATLATVYVHASGGIDTDTGQPPPPLSGACSLTTTGQVVAVTPLSSVVVGLMQRDPGASFDQARTQAAALFGFDDTFNLNPPALGQDAKLVAINNVLAHAAAISATSGTTAAQAIGNLVARLASGLATGVPDVSALQASVTDLKQRGKPTGPVAIGLPPGFQIATVALGDQPYAMSDAAIAPAPDGVLTASVTATATVTPGSGSTPSASVTATASTTVAPFPAISLDITSATSAAVPARFAGSIEISVRGPVGDPRVLTARLEPLGLTVLPGGSVTGGGDFGPPMLVLDGIDASGRPVPTFALRDPGARAPGFLSGNPIGSMFRGRIDPAIMACILRALLGTLPAGHPIELLESAPVVDLALRFKGFPVVVGGQRVGRIVFLGVSRPGASTVTPSCAGVLSTGATRGTTGSGPGAGIGTMNPPGGPPALGPTGGSGPTGPTTGTPPPPAPPGAGPTGPTTWVPPSPPSPPPPPPPPTGAGPTGPTTGTTSPFPYGSVFPNGPTTDTPPSPPPAGMGPTGPTTGTPPPPPPGAGSTGPTTGTPPAPPTSGTSPTGPTTGSASPPPPPPQGGTGPFPPTTGTTPPSVGMTGPTSGSAGPGAPSTGPMRLSTAVVGQVFDGPVQGAQISLFADAALTLPIATGAIVTDTTGSFHAILPTTAVTGLSSLYAQAKGGIDDDTGSPPPTLTGACPLASTTQVLAVTPFSSLVVGVMQHDPGAGLDQARTQAAALFGFDDTFNLDPVAMGADQRLLAINRVLVHAAAIAATTRTTGAVAVGHLISRLASELATGSPDLSGLQAALSDLAAQGQATGSVAIAPPPGFRIATLALGDGSCDLTTPAVVVAPDGVTTVSLAPPPAGASGSTTSTSLATATASVTASSSTTLTTFPAISLGLVSETTAAVGTQFAGSIEISLRGPPGDRRSLRAFFGPLGLANVHGGGVGPGGHSGTPVLVLSGTDASGHDVGSLTIRDPESAAPGSLTGQPEGAGFRGRIDLAAVARALRAKASVSQLPPGNPLELIDATPVVDVAIRFRGFPVYIGAGRVGRIVLLSLVRPPIGASATQ